MSQLRLNIVTNYVGVGWSAALTTLLIPLYISFVGIEAWGLVGLEMVLYSMVSLFNLGLLQTMIRDIASLVEQPEQAKTIRDILWTMFLYFIVISILVLVCVFLTSTWLAEHWLKAKQIPVQTVAESLVLLCGVVIAKRFFGLSERGLAGIHKQWISNAIRIPMDTCRHGVTLLLLWQYSPSVKIYFACQIVFFGLGALLKGFFLWRSLPKITHPTDSPQTSKLTYRPRWSTQWLQQHWRFSLGNFGIGLLQQFYSQTDKILLSTFLPLEMFGYYSLALMVAKGLQVFVDPMMTVAYPKLSQYVAQQSHEHLRAMYSLSTQMVATFVLPVAFFIAFYSLDILQVWTQNPTTAGQVHLLLSILIVGKTMSNLSRPPAILQLAHGWTQWIMLSQLIVLLLYIPTLAYSAKHYGALGAACVISLANISYFILNVSGMHRRLFPNEQWSWYKQSILIPLSVALALLCLSFVWIPLPHATLWKLVTMTLILAVTFVSTALSTSVLRTWIFQNFFHKRTEQFEGVDLF